MKKIMLLVGINLLLMTQTFALPTWYQASGFKINDGRGWPKEYTPSKIDFTFNTDKLSENYRLLTLIPNNSDETRYFRLIKKKCKDKITNDYILETWSADDYKDEGVCEIELYINPKTKNWQKIKFIFSNQEAIFKLK